jgi:pseudaminic acid cytidylyltransferase
MKLAVIPARGGSQRILGKNIKHFGGKPIIAWSIEVAIASELFDHIIVSTDDEEIAEIARFWGVETPFKRPDSLADEFTPIVPVIAHAIRACLDIGWSVDYACCIFPSSPFISADDLIATLTEVQAQDSDFIYPVTEFAHPMQRAMRRLPSGGMQFLSSACELTRTQDLEKTYHDAGQFYWGKASAWLEHKRMHTDGLGYPIPNWRVIDIDTDDDWKRAELLFSIVNNEEI